MNYHIFQCNFCGQKVKTEKPCPNKPWPSIEIHPQVDPLNPPSPDDRRKRWDACPDCLRLVAKTIDDLKFEVNERCGAEPDGGSFGSCSLRPSHWTSGHIDSDGNLFHFAKEKKDCEIDKLREELAALKNQSQPNQE